MIRPDRDIMVEARDGDLLGDLEAVIGHSKGDTLAKVIVGSEDRGRSRRRGQQLVHGDVGGQFAVLRIGRAVSGRKIQIAHQRVVGLDSRLPQRVQITLVAKGDGMGLVPLPTECDVRDAPVAEGNEMRYHLHCASEMVGRHRWHGQALDGAIHQDDRESALVKRQNLGMNKVGAVRNEDRPGKSPTAQLLDPGDLHVGPVIRGAQCDSAVMIAQIPLQ